MPSFALISEGITDQVVIEAVLYAFYRGAPVDNELSVTHLQPTRDATDISRQEKSDFGGWQQVLEHCSLTEHLYEAIALNDYIIIHIDSDICWHESVDIDPEQPSDELISHIAGLIFSKIDEKLLESYRDKIIVAVAIHSTECWIIPYHSNTPSERTKVNSCEAKLVEILSKNKIAFKKDYNCYMGLVKDMRKAKYLESAMKCSPSLAHFVSCLPSI